jgi:hypothetical protein
MPRLIEREGYIGPQTSVKMPPDFGRFNCLSGVVATAANTLCGLGDDGRIDEFDIYSQPLDGPRRSFSLASMPGIVERVARIRHLPIYYYQESVAYRRRIFRESIQGHISTGELVHLSLYGDRWKKEVYGKITKNGLAHAILVTGFSESGRKVSFQICDPWSRLCLMIPDEAVFKSVFGSNLGLLGEVLPGMSIPLSIFGLK